MIGALAVFFILMDSAKMVIAAASKVPAWKIMCTWICFVTPGSKQRFGWVVNFQ
jgi:hypothetical protein